ncbi:asparagine synthase-related protein [Actinomadura madurae]|uniref:asparagine synthase-related protein n=1 Tax=Actinomadura madurae TaxID=1993 RepID=UPI000D9366D5|nr:asparagine synthase-related protein [Actinomadura madurae]SPT51537.1 Asparagine synthase (glutamine-hydrolyzing) [Actinomadura madurae]
MKAPDRVQEEGVSRFTGGPLFLSEADGRRSADPLEIVPARRFSLASLAPSFANPWVDGEFRPACPWEGVRRVDAPPVLPPPGSSDPAELPARFRAAVEASMGDADTVVVMFSGGIDSTAVLWHAHEACRRQGRRLAVVTWGLRDQFGRSTGMVAERSLRGLGLDLDITVVPAEWRSLPEPPWSPAGPRHDYYVGLFQASVDLAEEMGAGVMLWGEGGDEILGACHYLTRDLARSRRWRDLRAYLWGSVNGESMAATAGELAAFAAPRLPAGLSRRLYTAFELSAFLRDLPEPVLRPPYQEIARVRRREWLDERAATFAERDHGRDWTQAAMWDLCFPFALDPYPLSAGVAQRSPFFDDAFLGYALGLPTSARFRRLSPYPYHWYKALHFRLIPSRAHRALPTFSQDYYPEFRRHALEVLPDGPLECVRLGLLRPLDRLDLERVHLRLPIVVRNIERWVAGALEHGAEPVGVEA